MTTSATQESGVTLIDSGAERVSVAFSVAKSSAGYRYTDLRVVNTVDADPQRLTVAEIVSESVAGFTVLLSGATDTANYSLQWGVEI